MSRSLIFYLLLFFCMSCTEERSIDESVDGEYNENIDYVDSLRPIRAVKYDLSSPKLKLITDEWESSIIYCAENEQEFISQVRAINRNGEITYVALSTILEQNDALTVHFKEFDGMGQLMSKRLLKGADFSIVDGINLRREGDYLFYYESLESHQAKYFSLLTGEHGDTTEKMIAWDFHRMNNFTTSHRAPNGSLLVTFYNSNLILNDLTDKSTDTLIRAENVQGWSFGLGTWNDESTKFYFDNSGWMACIWELDVERKTLNKIVPGHSAEHPFFFKKDSTSYIVYTEFGCIKLATLKVVQ